MFNRFEFNSIVAGDDCCEDCGKKVWEYLLCEHEGTNPPTDFGSLLKGLYLKLQQEKSRILLE